MKLRRNLLQELKKDILWHSDTARSKVVLTTSGNIYYTDDASIAGAQADDKSQQNPRPSEARISVDDARLLSEDCKTWKHHLIINLL